MLATAPEWILSAEGWRVRSRRLYSFPNGEAELLALGKGARRAQALAWFDNRQRIFPGYFTARHILWSGWNLAHRDLRLVLALSRRPAEDFAPAMAARWDDLEEQIWREKTNR